MTNNPKSHPGNASGKRGRPSHYPKPDGSATRRLHSNAGNSLPCAIRAEGGICGKPAYVFIAYPLVETSVWASPGMWKIQPVCQECAQAAAKVYE